MSSGFMKPKSIPKQAWNFYRKYTHFPNQTIPVNLSLQSLRTNSVYVTILIHVYAAGIVRIKSGSKPNNALTLKCNIFVTVVQLLSAYFTGMNIRYRVKHVGDTVASRSVCSSPGTPLCSCLGKTLNSHSTSSPWSINWYWCIVQET